MNFEVLNQMVKKIKCDVVGLFKDDKHNINYVVYTDGTKDEDGKLAVYASRFNKRNKFYILQDIEEDYEWDLVDEFLAKKDNK